MKILLAQSLLLAGILFSQFAVAGIVSETIDYKDGESSLRGFIFYDNAKQAKRPGVLVIHEWWGLNDYAKKRAKMLAELGYVAFAADMYGDGKVTRHAKEAGAWKDQITANIDAWQKRALLALDILKKHPSVDANKTAAIGYCFGGATVMQLAYTGADIDGVVSFHGSLPVASPAQAKAIRASILVAHGNADGFIPKERVTQFKTALDGSGIDWQMVSYGDTRHAFTNPDAGSYGVGGLQYNADADRRSWKHMQDFFAEIFSRQD